MQKKISIKIKNRYSWENNKNEMLLYLMFLPVLLYYLIFRITPIFGACIVAFKRYDIMEGIIKSPWVGFEYFIQFLNSIFFWRLIRNSLMINFYALVLALPYR